MSVGPSDLGFDLLPPDPGLVSPDVALDAALAPVVDYGEPVEQPLGSGWHFDFMTNQFVRAGQGPARAVDVDNLAIWIEKALRTARFAHPIYSDEFGLLTPFDLVGVAANGDLLAAYEEAITEALLTHDRILAVDQFQFTQGLLDDAIYVSFTVTLDSTATLRSQSLEFTNIPVPGVTS